MDFKMNSNLHKHRLKTLKKGVIVTSIDENSVDMEFAAKPNR